MNIFPVFQTILYTISTVLLYPVITLLIFLSIWMIIYTGGFIAEFVKRKRIGSSRQLLDSLDIIHMRKKIPEQVKNMLPTHAAKYAESLEILVSNKPEFLEELVEELNQRIESNLSSEVDKIHIIVKSGPALGLMGTLIPMGTGLAGLSGGNMAQLSSSLILAFTSTVVGIALGTSAYLFTVMKERWLINDMRDINIMTEAMMKKSSGKKTPALKEAKQSHQNIKLANAK